MRTHKPSQEWTRVVTSEMVAPHRNFCKTLSKLCKMLMKGFAEQHRMIEARDRTSHYPQFWKESGVKESRTTGIHYWENMKFNGVGMQGGDGEMRC